MPPTRLSSLQRPARTAFNPLRYPCDEPGCNRWFGNLSGLTKHKRTIHPTLQHHRQSRPDLAELPDHSIHNDQSANPHDPITEPTAADDPQESGINDLGDFLEESMDQPEGLKAEFVGPGHKLYRNYHTGLNGKYMNDIEAGNK